MGKLKKIESVHITFGNAMHQVIKKCVILRKEEKQLLDIEYIIDLVRHELNEAYRSSKNRIEWERYPSKNKMLYEIFYDGKLDEEDKKNIRYKILACSTNFLKSKTFNEIMNDQEVEFMEVDEDGFDNYMIIGGNKTYAKIDLLYRKKDQYVMVDWKTGKPNESDIYQAEVYALYLKEKHGISGQNVEFRMEYLLNNDVTILDIKDENIDITKIKIEESQNRMKHYLEDANLNKPLPDHIFDQSTNKYKCMKCNYRLICDLEFV